MKEDENRHEVGTRASRNGEYGLSKGAARPLGGAWTDRSRDMSRRGLERRAGSAGRLAAAAGSLACGEPAAREWAWSTRFGCRRRMRSGWSSARSVSAAELHAAYLDAIAVRNRELHAFLRHRGRAERHRHPDRAQGRHLDERRGDDGGLEDPRGLRPRVRRHRCGALQGGRAVAARQDQHGRVRDGLVDRELGVRARRTTRGIRAGARRLRRGLRRGRGRRVWPPGRSAPTPAARSSSRRRSAGTSAFARRTGPSPATASSRSPRASTRSGPSRSGARLRAPVLDHRRVATRATRRRSSCPSRSGCPSPTGSTASASVCRSSSRGSRGSSPASASAFEAAIELARGLGAEVGECDLPLSFEYGLACYYLIAPAEASSNLARYDGVRYGPRSRRRHLPRDGRANARPRLRGRAQAADHARHLRALGGLLRRLLRAGAEGAHADHPRAPRRPRAVRRHRRRRPRRPSPSRIGDKAADPLAMYACDLLTIPSCLAGLPGLNVPCGLSEGLPVGLQLIGPQFGENTLFRAGHALEQAIGFDTAPTRYRVVSLGAGDRARDPRAAEDADEDVLPLPRRIRRGREHADVPGLPRLPGRAAGARTVRRSSGRSSSGSRSAARSLRVPCSPARTTSTPICQRVIRSPSTIYLLAWMAR